MHAVERAKMGLFPESVQSGTRQVHFMLCENARESMHGITVRLHRAMLGDI